MSTAHHQKTYRSFNTRTMRSAVSFDVKAVGKNAFKDKSKEDDGINVSAAAGALDDKNDEKRAISGMLMRASRMENV
jgi:hypothetical protein